MLLEMNHQLRAAFYSWMACLEDEDVQKKGVVLVITGLEAGFHGKFTSRLFGNVVKVFGSVPLRPACIHFCTENTTAGHLASWVSKLLPFDARIRRRVHRGKYRMEWIPNYSTASSSSESSPVQILNCDFLPAHLRNVT